MNTYGRLRVLYVEDNRDSFEMLEVMLAQAGIDLVSAVSIADALTRAGADRFDLYLLDTGLPDGSGVSLCRTLRAVDPNIPVVFYSGNAHPDEIKMGIAAGATGYISKPHSDQLAETIMHLVTEHRGKAFSLASPSVVTAPAEFPPERDEREHRGERQVYPSLSSA